MRAFNRKNAIFLVGADQILANFRIALNYKVNRSSKKTHTKNLIMKNRLLLTSLALFGFMANPASAAILIPNGDFEAGATNWVEANGGSAAEFSFPTTGGNGGGGYGQIVEPGGGWAVLVSPPEPGAVGGGWDVASVGITPGTTHTFAIDLKTFSGSAGGGMKVEAWGGNSLLGNSGDVNAPGAFAEWTTFTFDWAVPAGTSKMVFVLLWGAGSTVGFDNVAVIPEPSSFALGMIALGLSLGVAAVKQWCSR